MTPSLATDWMLPIALGFSVFSGLLVLIITMRIGWKKTAVSFALVTYGLLGAILILSPKWHVMSAKWGRGSGELQLTALQNQLKIAEAENSKLKEQINTVARLDDKTLTAAGWIGAARNAKSVADWVDFIPGQNEAFKIAIPPDDQVQLGPIAAKLGKQTTELQAVMKDYGLTFFRDVTQAESMKTPITDLWLNPTSK
jgi:hypothetical protein